jgi:hypothetical protein
MMTNDVEPPNNLALTERGRQLPQDLIEEPGLGLRAMMIRAESARPRAMEEADKAVIAANRAIAASPLPRV